MVFSLAGALLGFYVCGCVWISYLRSFRRIAGFVVGLGLGILFAHKATEISTMAILMAIGIALGVALVASPLIPRLYGLFPGKIRKAIKTVLKCIGIGLVVMAGVAALAGIIWLLLKAWRQTPYPTLGREFLIYFLFAKTQFISNSFVPLITCKVTCSFGFLVYKYWLSSCIELSSKSSILVIISPLKTLL